MKKLRDAISKGKEREALLLAREFWPIPEPGEDRSEPTGADAEDALRNRLLGLLKVWPRQALKELGLHPGLAREREVEKALACRILLLNDEEFELLQAVPDVPWMQHARTVRSASGFIFQGMDDKAAVELRSLPHGSPFRESRLFLKGLSCFYRYLDSEAIKAFTMIEESECLGEVSRVFLYFLGVRSHTDGDEFPESDSALFQGLTAALGEEGLAVSAMNRGIRVALRRRQANHAIRELSRRIPDLHPVHAAFLKRDVASALLFLGISPDEIRKRFAKALSNDSLDPRHHHILALLLESVGDYALAGDSWASFLENVEEGVTAYPEELEPFILAGVCRHLARFLVLDASNHSVDLFGHVVEEDQVFDQLEEAHRLASVAVTADPGSRENWFTLVDITERLEDAKGLWHILENMLEYFPDDAEVLARCAEEAGKRGSTDKALKFIRRAVEIEPLNRSHRRREANLFLVKAGKYVRKEAYKKALETYESARSVSHLDKPTRLRISGELAAFYELLDSPEDIRREKNRILLSIPKSWLWTAYFVLGRVRIQRQSKRKPLSGFSIYDFIDARADILPEELMELTDLVSVDAADDRAGRQELMMLFRTAMSRGVSFIEKEDDFQRLIRTALDLRLNGEESLLASAERADELYPGRPLFVYVRYRTALLLRRPSAYFSEAVQVLRTQAHEWDERDIDEMVALEELFNLANKGFVYPFGRSGGNPFLELVNDVERYCRKADKESERAESLGNDGQYCLSFLSPDEDTEPES